MTAVLRVLAVLTLCFACVYGVEYSCCCNDGFILLGPTAITLECLYDHDYGDSNSDLAYTGNAQRVDICPYSNTGGVCESSCYDECYITGEGGFTDDLNGAGVTNSDSVKTKNCVGSNSFNIKRTFTTDCGGGQISVTQTINIKDDVAPELYIPDDITIECESTDGNPGYTSNNLFSANFGSARATDLCTNPTLTESSKTTSVSACSVKYDRTFSASDGCYTTTATQKITIQDTTAPEVLLADGVLNLKCDDPNIKTPAASFYPNVYDACQNYAGKTTSQYSDVSYPGKCTGDYTIERTWSATDTCAYTGTAVQIIVVRDTVPPTATYNGGSAAGDSFGDYYCTVPAPNVYTLSDNCATGSNLYLDYEQKIDGLFDFVQNYDIIRSYTASDDCGNSFSWRDVLHIHLGSKLTLTSTLNTQGATKGSPVTVAFSLLISVLCKTAYVVFDIGPAAFGGVTGLTGCTGTTGGGVVCEYASFPANGVTIPITITLTVPTTYQPNTLEIQASLIDGGLNNDYNYEVTQSTTLLTF